MATPSLGCSGYSFDPRAVMVTEKEIGRETVMIGRIDRSRPLCTLVEPLIVAALLALLAHPTIEKDQL